MKPIMLNLKHLGKSYPLLFTIAAFEMLSDMLPDGEKDYKNVLKLLANPGSACKACEILMSAAAEPGEKTPTAEEIKKAPVIALNEVQTACMKAIFEGLGIETDADENEEIDEVLAEKNAEKGD